MLPELEVAAVASESGSKKDTGSKETMTQIVSSMKKMHKVLQKVKRSHKRSRSRHRRDTSSDSSASESEGESGFMVWSSDTKDTTANIPVQGCMSRLQSMVRDQADKIRRVAGGRRVAHRHHKVYCSFCQEGMVRRSRSSKPTPPARVQVACTRNGINRSPTWMAVPDTGCTSSLASKSFV